MERELALLSDENVDFIDEEEFDNLSIYNLYSVDVGKVSSLNSDKNRVLLTEISIIISRLNSLFFKIGFDSSFFDKNRITWISDKVNYCLEHSTNKKLLEELKDEYNKYLLLSSKIIEGNLRLVIEIAGDYKENSLFDYNDIIQYGNIGLMKAVEKYNLECGTTFSTYARLWIKQVIGRNIHGVKSSYRIPSYAFYDGYNLMKKKNELDISLGRESNIKELSEYMGLSISEIKQLKKLFYETISLDEELGLYYGDTEITRGEMIPDSNVDVYEDGTYNIRIEQLKQELMSRLTERQYEVISKYIGIDGINYNLEEIAELLDISPQRVGQLKREAIKRLSLMPTFINKTLY